MNMKQEPRENPLILVVDDDRQIVRGLCVRLRSVGYDIVQAYDGEEGLSIAVEMQPDVIVLDIRMPVMDGLTMLKKLREHSVMCKVPAIVLSANIAEQARMKALELNASYFIQKPYESDKLLLAIASVLSSSAPRHEVSAGETMPPAI